jgi:hypothetical protein
MAHDDRKMVAWRRNLPRTSKTQEREKEMNEERNLCTVGK